MLSLGNNWGCDSRTRRKCCRKWTWIELESIEEWKPMFHLPAWGSPAGISEGTGCNKVLFWRMIFGTLQQSWFSESWEMHFQILWFFVLGSSIKIGLDMDFQSQRSRGFFGKDSQKHQKKGDCSLDLGPHLFITYQPLYNTPNSYKPFLHKGLTGNRKFGISSAFSKPVGLLNAFSTVSLHPSPSSWRVKRFCFHTC